MTHIILMITLVCSILSTPFTAQAVDYGVVLLPSKNDTTILETLSAEVANTLKSKGMIPQEGQNLFCVSLYQGAFDSNNLGKLIDAVGKYSEKRSRTLVKINEMRYLANAVWMTFQPSPELTKMSDRFFEARIPEIRNVSKNLKSLKGEDATQYSPLQKDNMQKYGIHWNVPGAYDHRLAVLYGTMGGNEAPKALAPLQGKVKEVMLDRVAVVALGPQGNAESILAAFPLLN